MMGEIKTSNQEKFRTLREKEIYKYLGIFEVNTIKYAEMKKIYIKKIIPQENEKSTQNQTTSQKSYQRDKYVGCSPR